MNLDCVAQVLVWRDGEVVGRTALPEELAALIQDPHTLVWVDLVAPSPADLASLATQLSLGAASVEDATAPHERPKVIRRPGYLFFQTYATALDLPQAPDPETGVEVSEVLGHEGRLTLSRISGYVLPKALVTVRLDDVFDMSEVVRRWEADYDLVAHGPGALLHGLLDAVVDGHFDTIQRLDDAIEALEDVLFENGDLGGEFLRSVYGCARTLCGCAGSSSRCARWSTGCCGTGRPARGCSTPSTTTSTTTSYARRSGRSRCATW